jgi:biopolymer transport protein ExbD
MSMKSIKYPLLLAVLAIGFCAAVRADDKSDFPRISFVGPGTGHAMDPSQYIKLVVEGATLSFEKNPVPEAGEVDYVNDLLKIKNVSMIAVFTREGIKYGDVVRAIDLLRKTNAKNVGVSMVQLAPGREP